MDDHPYVGHGGVRAGCYSVREKREYRCKYGYILTMLLVSVFIDDIRSRHLLIVAIRRVKLLDLCFMSNDPSVSYVINGIFSHDVRFPLDLELNEI